MMLKVDLAGRRALVTGASQGIGETVARRLAECGAEVVLAARSTGKLEAVASRIRETGGSASIVQMDVGDPDSISAALESLSGGDAFTILVNNAGVTRDNLFLRMKDEEWETVHRINLEGAFRVTRGLVRPMMKARWGRVVNISSVVAGMGNAGQANYVAAKAGLEGFTRAIARELAGRGITVNAVAPGFIETAMTEALGEKVREELLGLVPLGRLGTPDDVASAVVFLCSPDAGYITGQVLGVNGGMRM